MIRNRPSLPRTATLWPSLATSTSGGVTDSAHRYGCAADLVPVRVSVEAAWRAAKRLELPYDQCIWERRGKSEWLHIAIERPGTTCRGQHFRIWR